MVIYGTNAVFTSPIQFSIGRQSARKQEAPHARKQGLETEWPPENRRRKIKKSTKTTKRSEPFLTPNVTRGSKTKFNIMKADGIYSARDVRNGTRRRRFAESATHASALHVHNTPTATSVRTPDAARASGGTPPLTKMGTTSREVILRIRAIPHRSTGRNKRT